MEECRKTFKHKTKNSMAADLSFIDSRGSSDFEEHKDVLSRNNIEKEHSDEEDHPKLRAAIEEIGFDEFEGL